jgi:hypothetical protein
MHEMVGADRDRQPARDLAHRGEQRQGTVPQLHGLVRDGRRPGREERVGERTVGGEVQVCEEREVGAQEAVFARDGLLDLQDEIGTVPGLGSGVDDPRARCRVVSVRDSGSRARARLHENLVPVPPERVRSARGERDAILVVLDLGGYRDSHSDLLVIHLVGVTRASQMLAPMQFERTRFGRTDRE